MQIKNKIIIFFLLYFFTLGLNAEEFDISATEITFDKSNNIVMGKGSVKIVDQEGKIFKSDYVIYDKSKEFLTIEGSVEVFDIEGNILKTNKATYDKKNELINTFDDSELTITEGYKLKSKNIVYNINERIILLNRANILEKPFDLI